MKLADNVTELEISINDQLLPLENFACPQIQIDGSDEFGIPILMLSLVDNTGGSILRLFNPIADGSLLSIKFSRESISNTREFRVSAVKSINGASLLIRAYLNHPSYVVESERRIYNMTSSEALKAIADKCGLAFECPVTADKMKWQPLNQRLINFARFILSASYINDTSIMMGRITLDGAMRIRNLDNLPVPTSIFGFATGAIPLYGFVPTSLGSKNMHGGYKSTLVTPDMFGNYNSIDGMEVSAKERSFNLNPKMVGLVGDGTIKCGTLIHPSNQHKYFDRAIYNNKRAKSIFSMTATMATCGMISNVDALDVTTVDNHNTADSTAEGNLGTNYDGDWVVSNKSIYVDNNQYFERFNLIRAGLNLDLYSDTV